MTGRKLELGGRKKLWWLVRRPCPDRAPSVRPEVLPEDFHLRDITNSHGEVRWS
ncbi:hypothetical protein SNOG_11386 [Parastagonospora nodorum SN15]|uniref:Uncharacterized protein n=1 Tax=Phaeosphaeria nodorum (strain SN15 / ATCC MYA-4574 / FGSC 10173) TaxID=321614 RepID=Q0UA28_PHANO|nr:hypothetical protein SNOG_11386 [Parastagonospora nodorum SN15]EAT81094.1 hypothetical protein SNOG_11386 [Parastagonospora nodorum SN15]